MEHLLHRLCGVDAPESTIQIEHYSVDNTRVPVNVPYSHVLHCN